MASFICNAAPHDGDLDARCQRIRQRLLDGIEETLDELAQSNHQPAAQQAAIADAVWAHVAPLLCRQATCRRAKRCRRNPCAVPRVAPGHEAWRFFANGALSRNDTDASRGN